MNDHWLETAQTAAIELLNKQLIASMAELDIPSALQDKIMNLPTQQKESMLELYIRQTRINKKPKPPSNDPILDSQLSHRMAQLYVPKHIQSQIMSLPTEKKRILLIKYNKQQSQQNQHQHLHHLHELKMHDLKMNELKEERSREITTFSHPKRHKRKHKHKHKHNTKNKHDINKSTNIHPTTCHHIRHRSSTRITHTRAMSNYTNNTHNTQHTNHTNNSNKTNMSFSTNHTKTINHQQHHQRNNINMNIPNGNRKRLNGIHRYSNSQNNISSIFDASFLENVHREFEDSTNINTEEIAIIDSNEHKNNLMPNGRTHLLPQQTQTSIMVNPSNNNIVLPSLAQSNSINTNSVKNIILPKSPNHFCQSTQKQKYIQLLSKQRLPMAVNSQSDILTNINSSRSIKFDIGDDGDIDDEDENALDDEKQVKDKKNNSGQINSNLESELFDIMDQLDLTTEIDQSIKYLSDKRKKSIVMHPGSSISSQDGHDDDAESREIFICLRCLKRINIMSDKNINTKCRFHAFSSQGPDYEDVGYFMQRNNELSKLRDFNFACCNRKCRGVFNNCKSQQNGCHVKQKHLFQFAVNDIQSQLTSHDEEDLEESESKHENEFTVTDEQIEGGRNLTQKNVSISADVSGIEYIDKKPINISGNIFNKNESKHHVELEYDRKGTLLCGKWKMFVYKNEMKQLFMIRDIDIIKHTKQGQIKGILCGTTYIDGNKYENKYDDDEKDDDEKIYCGQLKDNQLILTYRGKKTYTASYLLCVEEYELNGQWIDSIHQKGNCQWFKIQKLL